MLQTGCLGPVSQELRMLSAFPARQVESASAQGLLLQVRRVVRRSGCTKGMAGRQENLGALHSVAGTRGACAESLPSGLA